MTVQGLAVTKGARAAIEAAGGRVEGSMATSRRLPRRRHVDGAGKSEKPGIDRQRAGRATPELRHRLLFLFGALIVYRIGTHIPVPGINPVALAQFFSSRRGTILDLFNMFSGGALERMSIFALGVMPYISRSSSCSC